MREVRKMSGDASVTRKQNVYEVKYKKIQLKDLQFVQGDNVSTGTITYYLCFSDGQGRGSPPENHVVAAVDYNAYRWSW